jgi:lysophospholipase L1-like esterase
LKSFANINGLKYVDVTEISRRAINESNLITSDNLHPSGLMYLEWAKKIFNVWIN